MERDTTFFFLLFNFKIDDVFKRSKIPIIVGGTNYWIEALLWKNLVSPGVGLKRKINTDYEKELQCFSSEIQDFFNDSLMSESMLKMESEKLFEHLKVVDSITANKLHPNNKRKIMR